MNLNIIVQPEVEVDLLEAVVWYENKLQGLGESFLLNVEATIRTIKRNPEAFPKVYKEIRRVLIKKFPFGIFYLIEKERIVILAIFHASRSPKNWKGSAK